jgi:hypothetical protein
MKKKAGSPRKARKRQPAAQSEAAQQPPREERLVGPVSEDLGGGYFKYCRTFPEASALGRHPDGKGAFRLPSQAKPADP